MRRSLGAWAQIFEGLTFSQISGNRTGVLYVGAISGAVGCAFPATAPEQKYAEPALASLLMCLESVFGALGRWLIGGEVLRPLEYLGCALLLPGCAGRPAAPAQERPAAFSKTGLHKGRVFLAMGKDQCYN